MNSMDHSVVPSLKPPNQPCYYGGSHGVAMFHIVSSNDRDYRGTKTNCSDVQFRYFYHRHANVNHDRYKTIQAIPNVWSGVVNCNRTLTC